MVTDRLVAASDGSVSSESANASAVNSDNLLKRERIMISLQV